jgi:competence protein ComEC
MIKWVPFAFVRIILFFISGIIFGIYFPNLIPDFVSLAVCASLGCLYLLLFFLARIRNGYFFNLGFIGLPLVFLSGYAHLQFQTDSRLVSNIVNQNSAVNYYSIVLTSSPQKKENSWKAEAKLLQIYTDRWESSEGNILIYFSKEAYEKRPAYGDVFLIEGCPQILQHPANPGEFDYKKFLGYRNIYHQDFLRTQRVIRLENDPPSKIMASAIKARLWADSTLTRHVRGEREQAIASALVLGVVDNLDSELLNAYAATGAMHVLAVSGLHISIIYMLLLTLVKPIKKIKHGEWILAIIGLTVLWGYAFVTGLSPSVLRAVTMFSFMAISKPMNRNTNIYNTMAASAFCILLFDPYLIMSVGFQLSYLAVIGIVYLQPGLYELWQPKQRLWDEIWKISCVSIAAQISTFALGLLYFHQFPNYFLLSNLLVIPASFLVLISGIGVLAISFIPVLASVLGWVLTWLIKLMNLVVFAVEKIPFSLVENIHVTVAQCWLLVLMMLFVILMFQKRKFFFLPLGFCVTIVYAFLQWSHHIQEINRDQITVYNIKGHSAIDLIDEGQTFFLTDSVFKNDAGNIRFHIKPNRLLAGVGVDFPGEQLSQRNVRGGTLVFWKKRTFALATDTSFRIPPGVHLNFIIVSNNSVKDIEHCAAHSDQIILDSSNSYYYSRRINNIALSKKLNIHAVMIDGAFDEFVTTI